MLEVTQFSTAPNDAESKAATLVSFVEFFENTVISWSTPIEGAKLIFDARVYSEYRCDFFYVYADDQEQLYTYTNEAWQTHSLQMTAAFSHTEVCPP